MDRDASNAETRSKARMFDALMSSLPVGIYFKDEEARHVRVSDHQCRQYDEGPLITADGERLTDPADFVGKTDLDIYPESIAEETYADDVDVIESGDPVIGREERHPRPNGEDVWVSTTKVPWHDETGEVRGLIGTSSDISELKRTQQRLERQNKRLEEFTSIVSHDLRNPLNVAEGHLEMARDERDSGHLAEVASAHDRMCSLIDDLLTLASGGEDAMDLESVSLPSVVEDAWRTVDTGDVSLTIAVEGRIEADRPRLQQLLENLYRNAVEHGETTTTVTVGAIDEGFYVADDGHGIPHDDRETVFERGYTTADSGTGYGLRIVEQVAEAHGWTVTVTESDAGGARFEIADVVVVDGITGSFN